MWVILYGILCMMALGVLLLVWMVDRDEYEYGEIVMTKKKETPEKIEKEATDPTGSIHLKVLADLFTVRETYLQGVVIEVSDAEASRLVSEHAGYFEVVSTP